MDQNTAAKPTPVATQTANDPGTEATKLDPKARKAKYEAELKERKKTAKARVLQFVKDNEKDLGGIAEDVKLLIGARGPSAVRAVGVVKSVNADLKAAFAADFAGAKAGLTEMDIFKTYHVGRPEMANKMRFFVLGADATKHVWVEFDEAKETYFCRGVGATPPAGFKGYVPEAKVL